MKRTLAAAGLAAFLAVPAANAQDDPVSIGTLPQGSLGYAIAAAVADVAGEETGRDIRAVGQGGSSVFIPALARGAHDFTTSNAAEAVFAATGTGNFEGNPNPEVRLAALLQPFVVGIMVAADGDIDAIADLEGRPFPVGYARQRLVKVMQDAALASAGMSEADLDGVPVPNFVEGADLLAQGTVAGVLLAPGSGVVKRTMAQRPVRFISLPEGAGPVIEEALPGAYVQRVEPSDRLPEIAEPVDLIGYQYALLTHADAPDELVYEVVKAIHGNKDALIERHGSFRGFDPADMATDIEGVAYHPAAERFYREAGVWPSE